MVRIFANSLGDPVSIPGRVIPKTKKIVFDASLLNMLHYKVQIKSKWTHNSISLIKLRQMINYLLYALVK